MTFEIGYYDKNNKKTRTKISAKTPREALNKLAEKLGVKREWVKELTYFVGREDESRN